MEFIWEKNYETLRIYIILFFVNFVAHYIIFLIPSWHFSRTYGHHDKYCIDHGKYNIDVYKFEHQYENPVNPS